MTELDTNKLFLIAGPCIIENRETAFGIARYIKEITDRLGIPYIFKGSYRKANRSRLDSFTGIGDHEALKILADIRSELGIATLTDIHSAQEAPMAAEYVDILQIPAFLCRQTDIIQAAAATGKPVNIKKGQFVAPDAMKFVVEKHRAVANHAPVFVTERGTMFGYQDLIVDIRSIPRMKQACQCPMILDVTHSLQQPNQTSGVSGGCPEMIETLALAGTAAGCDGLFIETHPDPSSAKSDGANMLRLDLIGPLLEKVTKVREVIDTFK